MVIFMLSLFAFFLTLFIIYPKHNTTEILPQAPDFGRWWLAVEAIIMLGDAPPPHPPAAALLWPLTVHTPRRPPLLAGGA